jgi:hypothetical protein
LTGILPGQPAGLYWVMIFLIFSSTWPGSNPGLIRQVRPNFKTILFKISQQYPQYFPGCVIFICINFLFFLKKSNKYEDMVDWLMEVTIKVDISLLIGHIIKSMVNQNCSPSFKRQA